MASEPGQEFNDVAQYPYMCVASPSCHDTSTTRAWWEEDAARRVRFFHEKLEMQVGPCNALLPYEATSLEWCWCVPATPQSPEEMSLGSRVPR